MPFRKYECVICGYIYDEELGDPEDGLAPELDGKIFQMNGFAQIVVLVSLILN